MHPPHSPQPTVITQEMLVAQAKENAKRLEARLSTMRECLTAIEDARSSATLLMNDGGGQEAIMDMISAVAKVQYIQLSAALREGMVELETTLEMIRKAEGQVKIFRPLGVA